MIAKIIAHGADRAAALERLAAALDATQVEGVTTNLGFLRAAAGSPSLQGDGGSIPAGSIARAPRPWPAELPADAPTLLLAALATVALSLARPGPPPLPGTDWTSPWHRRDAWRLNQAPHGLVRLLDGETLHIVTVEGTGERFTARLGDDELHARCGVADGRVWVESDGWRRSFPATIVGHTLTLTIERPTACADPGGRPLRRAWRGGGSRAVHRPDAGQGDQAAGGGGRPGEEGPGAGGAGGHEDGEPVRGAARRLVTAVHVREGDQVEEGAVLLDLQPEEAAA